ncbi:hypothetical protein MF628_000827 [Paenibacillus polymyxa]|uniref:hypothetical protein n=1 Tax=Paenibacillus polymyxa TaxID=1406 RepID=UPI002024EE81|nr:hypothetical protein [Paenibacillus polymyxa]URJ46304.1 hypothetical protein MF628_000827 [Paenibacillus polymyxa]
MNIRMYHDLEAQLEEEIWAFGEEAAHILPLDSNLAEEKAQRAWDLIPEPKHTWGITGVTLHHYVQILNYNGHTQRSVELLNGEILDLEGAGYRIIHAEPYIQMAQTLLHQSKPVLAHEYLKKAYSIGSARAFRDQPKLYLKMAKSKALDEQDILLQFAALDVNAKLLSDLKDNQ